MHPARDHHLPLDPDAYRHAPHPQGRIIVIAPTRAACETIELALGLHLDTVLEREHGEEIRDAGPRRARASASWPAPAPGRRSASGRSPRRSCGRRSRGRGQPGARSDAGDAQLERRHRHHRHRAALVPGRPDHRRATRSSSTRSTRPRPSWSCVWRSASGPAAASSGSAPRSTRPSTPATSTARRCWRPSAFDPRAQGARCKVLPQKPEEFLERALHPAPHQGEARGGGVPPDPRRGRAAGARSWASSGRGSRPRSITAASRSASSGRFSKARWSGRSCWP